MGKTSLQLQQLNSKMLGFTALKQVAMPPTGWIKAIRNALGMSMQQLGAKLNVSKQGVMDIEKREKDLRRPFLPAPCLISLFPEIGPIHG
jgi:DNA-binding transcriptional regulator YiaG